MADSDVGKDKGDTSAAAAPDRTRVHNKQPRGGLGVPPPERGPAAYLAEFIGTFGLVFFICVAVVLYAPPPVPAGTPGLPPVQPFQDWSVIGLVHAFVLFSLIQALAVVSGAHFNPAVTTAMTLLRQIRPIDAAIYILVQLVGGIAAAFVCKAMFDNENAGEAAGTFGAPGVGAAAGGSASVAFAAELIGTFFLVWAIVGIAVNPRGTKDWAGFAIGATLGFALFVFGPVSGGSFNPARAFGPSLIGEFTESAGTWILVWVVAPVLGALIAALLYFRMFILPGSKGEAGMEPVG